MTRKPASWWLMISLAPSSEDQKGRELHVYGSQHGRADGRPPHHCMWCMCRLLQAEPLTARPGAAPAKSGVASLLPRSLFSHHPLPSPRLQSLAPARPLHTMCRDAAHSTLASPSPVPPPHPRLPNRLPALLPLSCCTTAPLSRILRQQCVLSSQTSCGSSPHMHGTQGVSWPLRTL